MRFYFLPAECGDFRVERAGDGASVLTVVDPTAADRERLLPFFARARQLGWLDTEPELAAAGESVIPFRQSVREVGTVLAGESARPDGEVWTVLRHEGGVYLVDGVPLVGAKNAVVEEAVAAATVTAPNKGCPAPSPCARRPWEVLSTFATRRQMDDYQAHGRMKVIGGATGRLYHVHHRDEAARIGLDRCVTVGESGRPMCMWEARVPAEEETLALMLALQFRERDYLPYEMPRPIRAR